MTSLTWFSFECLNGCDVYLDVRATTQPVIRCPTCNAEAEFKGSWPALEDSGAGSRGDYDYAKQRKSKTADGRNITENYFGWSNLEIKEDLDSKRLDYGVLCCNIVGDYNLSCIVRSANVFLAREVIIYGKRSWDKRGAVGTQHYTNFRFVELTDDLGPVFSEYDEVIGVDNVPGAQPLDEAVFLPALAARPKRTLFVFGEERAGVPKLVLDRCHRVLYIRQLGSCRSLNVASAASIVLHHYVRER